jgi:hypothetical protein
MKAFFNATFTDLGPFRAIKYESYSFKYGRQNLWMDGQNSKGFKMTYVEIPVRYKNRIEISKCQEL